MLDRNKILDILNDEYPFMLHWQLRYYIENNSDVIIPNRKERKMSIVRWVEKHLDEIAPF